MICCSYLIVINLWSTGQLAVIEGNEERSLE